MYSEEFKGKIKQLCVRDGIYKTCKDWGLTYTTIKKWVEVKHTTLSPRYTLKECTSEYIRIKQLPGSLSAPAKYNRNVHTFQPHYYEKEIELWRNPKNQEIRDRIYANRLQYVNKTPDKLSEREILICFKRTGIHIGFTGFSPLWFKYFITKYNINTVYDPCGGWGHRLIGGYMLKQYIYNDMDARTCNGVRDIIKHNNITNAIVYNNDSSQFTPSEEYEAVFTCPPYFNVEIYNNKPFKNLGAYRDWWGDTIISSTKNKNLKYFAFVINDTYCDLLINISKQHLNIKDITKEEITPYYNKVNRFGRKSLKKEYLVVLHL